MDDPILLTAVVIALITIPILSNKLSNIRPRYAFLPPILAMIVAVPMFTFVMIVSTLDISFALFVVSGSLWTGGFFGVFVAWIMYKSKNKQL